MMTNREIDAMVAEKAMGLRKDRVTPDWFEYADGSRGPAPEYSTDIAAAWQVVEKMRAGGTCFSCGSPYKYPGIRDAPCWARFGGNMERPSPAMTVPYAICLAALAAIGVEVPEPQAPQI